MKKDRLYALLWSPGKGTLRISTVSSMVAANDVMFVTGRKPKDYELPMFISFAKSDLDLMRAELERIRSATLHAQRRRRRTSVRQ